MEWVLKTSPEKLLNTFLNRTSPSEVGDEGSDIIDYGVLVLLRGVIKGVYSL